MDNGPDSFPEIDRDLESRRRESERPKADKVYVRELADLYSKNDGRYLHELLHCIADEVEGLMMLDKENNAHRSLAMIQTKLTEAKHWAHEYGIAKNSLVILDRRRFATEDN